MRRMPLLLLVLAGCAGSDADPVAVAERFHALRVAGDDSGLHALLTDADRAMVPLAAFPDALPASAALELLTWAEARLDSASLLGAERDTAAVQLHVVGGTRDTLRLLATHHPIGVWRLKLDRVRWRVSMGLEERAVLDSLATALRASERADHGSAVALAGAYLEAAGRYPDGTRPADVDFARGTVRRAAVAEALRIDLRVDRSFTGKLFVGGEIANPTRNRIATLRLTVRDQVGDQERVELWDIAPGATIPVRQMTRLRLGPLTHQLERIQVF